ncbi:MAG: hypothetical protein KF797_05390 [Flavobacteriales bacterium]|nr:hypothetical protein [Flavobacteriales bacterium]
MEVKLDIPFNQLLRIIRQLTPVQQKKVQAVLEQANTAADRPKSEAGEESLSELLLRGPVFSKEQLVRMKETRKAFEQWRDL